MDERKDLISVIRHYDQLLEDAKRYIDEAVLLENPKEALKIVMAIGKSVEKMSDEQITKVLQNYAPPLPADILKPRRKLIFGPELLRPGKPSPKIMSIILNDMNEARLELAAVINDMKRNYAI